MAKRTKLDLSEPTPARPAREQAVEQRQPAGPRDRQDRPDRVGKKMIGGFFPESVWRELRQLALDTDRTLQDVLDEALTDVLAKHRKRSR